MKSYEQGWRDFLEENKKDKDSILKSPANISSPGLGVIFIIYLFYVDVLPLLKSTTVPSSNSSKTSTPDGTKEDLLS